MRDGEIVSDTRNPEAGQRPPSRPTRPCRIRCAAALRAPARARDHGFWAFALMIMAAAVQALRRNMMRSALTMLGVFIGVAALIAMVAVGQGANDAVRKQIERLGTNLVVVLPGARTAGGMRARIRQRVDAHDQRRASDPARERRGRRGQLPHPPVRPG